MTSAPRDTWREAGVQVHPIYLEGSNGSAALDIWVRHSHSGQSYVFACVFVGNQSKSLYCRLEAGPQMAMYGHRNAAEAASISEGRKDVGSQLL